MNKSIVWVLLALTGLFVCSLAGIAQAAVFKAYSLQEAERRLRRTTPVDSELTRLGEITAMAGLVYDKETGDLILVGQVEENREPILLDDFVVAMRSLLVHNEWPLVSIDKDTDESDSQKRLIRFEGGIENTQFGRDFLEADITLKKMSLDLLPTDIWGIRSYFALAVDEFEENTCLDAISSRFWYDVFGKGSLAVRDGVFAIDGFRIGIYPQVISVNGKPVSHAQEIRDEVAERFAAAVNNNMADLCAYYPEIGRLKTLFDLVCLAKGIQTMSARPDLDYFLYDYLLTHNEIPAEFTAITRKANREVAGVNHVLHVEGGVELRALIMRIEDGDVTALRDVVLKSRPTSRALTWEVPLDGWQIPGHSREEFVDEPAGMGTFRGFSSGDARIGCYVSRRVGILGGLNLNSEGFVSPPFSRKRPDFDMVERLSTPTFSTDVGGVMLQGTAAISGDSQADVDLSSGSFCLIVGGERARLDPQVHRKFNTALWSVYFSDIDPGISIDPIAPGADKHLVRYIGRVINTDLGRIMREADYLMKKWAVGTERPAIPGFKCVDDLTARHGLRYIGASRRFWFVPEQMRFRSGDGMLLFDDGRMTCRTEYVFQDRTYKAEPADEAFAEFFSEHYQEIAEEYPVYGDLFDYAKMVSLAKYLKQSGVPLLWYLMANRDLILTEDSPGTVEALARGSAYFEGLEIEGGVDLGSEGEYVYDAMAVDAIADANSRLNSTTHSLSGLSPSEDAHQFAGNRFSFDLENHSYSVIPHHSLTSGRDRRGIRYQTDLAFRHNGEPGLELVRYFNPRQQTAEEFGQGWHLLIPYQIKPHDATSQEFLNAIIPEQMVLENLLTGEGEVLTFSTDRYTIAGYVPDVARSSQTIGLFIMSDASYRLADKLGNEFWFDQAGYLTDIILSDDYHMHFDYFSDFTNAFDKSPYELHQFGENWVDVLNARMPERLIVEDVINGDSEVFVFCDTTEFVGYVPESEQTSRFEALVVMSDGSFRLLDNAGNENAFTPAGRFQGAVVFSERPMIASISLGQQRVDFIYQYDQMSRARIVSAHYSIEGGAASPAHIVRYHYDDADRLCRIERVCNRDNDLRFD